MEKEIEKEIVNVLKNKFYEHDQILCKSIANKLNCAGADVVRVVYYMKDREELESLPHDTTLVRLTHEGKKAHATGIEKIIEYIKNNWIALIGAVTGISGIVISIIALNK